MTATAKLPRLDDFEQLPGFRWTSEERDSAIDAAIANFNADPPFDDFYGEKVFHRARRPILATDCDYEIVTVSGVQGRRVQP